MKQTVAALAFFLATACLAPEALALTGAEYMAMEKAQAEAIGATITHERVEETGEGSFVIHGVVQTGSDGSTARMESIRFEGVRAMDGGGYAIDEVEMNGISASMMDPEHRKIDLTMRSMTTTGGQWLASGLKFPLPAGRVEQTILDTRLSMKESELFVIERMVSTMTVAPDGYTVSMVTEAPSLAVSTNVVQGAAKAKLTELDLMPLELSLALNATLDLKSGRFDLESYRLGLRNAGAIIMQITLGGMTKEWLEGLIKILMQPNAQTPEMRDAVGAQMTEALKELSLVSASLSYEDGGIARKAMAQQAAALGISEKDFVALGAQMANERLQAIEPKALAASVSSAFKHFIADPRSVTVLLSPAGPVAITDLVGDAIASKEKLVERLGLAIEVNGKRE